MIAIKHRFSEQTLCEFDVFTIKEAAEKGKLNLRGANLDGANLYGANLECANLDGANLRGANLECANLYGANLRGANLDGANLRGANLRGANLYGANLECANLDGEEITKNPISIAGIKYWCLISDNYMRLGCKRFTHAEWESFTDEEISAMDFGALDFWQQWKDALIKMCKSHSLK